MDLRDLLGAYEALRAQGGGTPEGAMLQSDINRGVVEGTPTPALSGMSPADQARLDRYAWGRAAGVQSIPAGLPATLFSEAVKVPGVGAALQPVTNVLARLSGQDPAIFEVDETSSPPSLGNVGAYLMGAGGNLRDLIQR